MTSALERPSRAIDGLRAGIRTDDLLVHKSILLVDYENVGKVELAAIPTKCVSLSSLARRKGRYRLIS